MKPEWCPQEIWVISDQLIGCDDDAPPSPQDIARALLDAHQRGKDEKEREVAALLKNSAAVRVNYLRGRIACQPLIDEAHQRGKEEGHAEGRREGMEEAAEVAQEELERARVYHPEVALGAKFARDAIRAKAQEVKT